MDARDEDLLWALHDLRPKPGRAYWPSIKELRAHLGWPSTSSVWLRLERLWPTGLIEIGGGWVRDARSAHPARNVAFITEGGVRRIGIAEPVT